MIWIWYYCGVEIPYLSCTVLHTKEPLLKLVQLPIRGHCPLRWGQQLYIQLYMHPQKARWQERAYQRKEVSFVALSTAGLGRSKSIHSGVSAQLRCFVLFPFRSYGYQLGFTVAVVSAQWLVENVKNYLQMSRLSGRGRPRVYICLLFLSATSTWFGNSPSIRWNLMLPTPQDHNYVSNITQKLLDWSSICRWSCLRSLFRFRKMFLRWDSIRSGHEFTRKRRSCLAKCSYPDAKSRHWLILEGTGQKSETCLHSYVILNTLMIYDISYVSDVSC